MKISLKNKRALVGGSSKGLGYAVAKQLAISGAKVTLVARNVDALRDNVNELNKLTNIQHEFLEVNYNKFEDYKEKSLNQKVANPALDEGVSRTTNDKFSVVKGVCTHLSCAPKYHPEIEPKAWDEDWKGGFFCPCHGSKFDLAGRVYKNVPAPTNLEVPPHSFEGDTLIIGEA